MRHEEPSRAEIDIDPIASIDRTVHGPARLIILAQLAVVENADFVHLLRRTGLTRGNLSGHLRILEEAGYVSVSKEFVDRIPRTLVRLTPTGRDAIEAYRQVMRQVVDQLLAGRATKEQ
jgi:DNA-binding MarR family transcriptional regulator